MIAVHSKPLPAKRNRKFLGLGISLVILLFGVGLSIRFSPLYITLNQNPGSFDRAHNEAIVARVRALNPAPGEAMLLRLDDPDEPKSLRLVKPDEQFARGQGVGNVWARSRKGHLTVVIETRDLGHAGEYGFAYSDEALSLEPFGDHWFTLDVPSKINIVQPDMQIDAHWWKVVYNLD